MSDTPAFEPDWVSAPGDTMADLLEERDLSLRKFAALMGHTPEHVNELLKGRVLITIRMARKLEAVLGGSATFWMLRESQYREDLARLQNAQEALTEADWLSEIPVKDMIKFGWLRPNERPRERLAACLHFFGVPTVAAWREAYGNVIQKSAFRTSQTFQSNVGAVAAWLRRGEIESEAINCKPWDSERFRKTLFDVRAFTRKKDPNSFIPELVKHCAESGVALVVVRGPNGCRASGATRFLSSKKALMVLSFRYLSDDHFWFTFFHEAGHLLLHGKEALFLEGDNSTLTKEEREANDFAAKALVPQEFEKSLLNLPADPLKIIKFARQVGVSPGIIVGQLQHFGRLKRNQLNSLKRRFTWPST